VEPARVEGPGFGAARYMIHIALNWDSYAHCGFSGYVSPKAGPLESAIFGWRPEPSTPGRATR